jgi:hypothetical protein
VLLKTSDILGKHIEDLGIQPRGTRTWSGVLNSLVEEHRGDLPKDVPKDVDASSVWKFDALHSELCEEK